MNAYKYPQYYDLAFSYRDYSYTGLDLNQEMIDYAATSSTNLEGDIQFTAQDMNDFHLTYKVDLVYVLLGSFYAKSNKECLQHFDRVADSLNQGGLYILDEVVYFNLFDDRPSQCCTSFISLRNS